MNEEHSNARPQRSGDIQEPGSGDPAAGLAGLPADYPQFLAEVKARIAAARTRAVLAVNSELIRLYWEIGHEILEREQREGWGSGVINRLASDLRREFPNITGFSRSNLHYMRSFAEAWPSERGSDEIVQQPVGQLPWGQNIALVTRIEGRDARVWYAAKAVQHGWSRKVLKAQIATDLRSREGSALTSFEHTHPVMPTPGQSVAIWYVEDRKGQIVS